MSPPAPRKLHSEKHTFPVIALLTTFNTSYEGMGTRDLWRVSMSKSSDPEFSFINANTQQGIGHTDVDAFDVLERFLDLHSPEEVLAFFQRYGPFQLLPQEGSQPRQAQSVRWSHIKQAQSDFEAALKSPTLPAHLYEFVFQTLKIQLRFRAVTPESRLGIDDAAIADCEDVVTALRASVFLTRKSGFRWKRCARKRCNKLFELDTKRDRIFCSSDCAQISASNAYNARQKKSKRKKGGKR